ncbi:aminoglycoside 3'-phosphotransferase [Actinomycetospora sp. OC33-EN08]|uniref:Aminoglycoside 3'-phosphotransferase n=1 Tax=Actinomycetospora aurantiaca TaxID=3129233 RepID=A0ABU8MKZ5_9PSEU
MRPDSPVEVPDEVARFAAGRPLECVWRNELGGLTFAVRSSDYVKWSPPGVVDLGPEVERLAWAARHVVVPRVLTTGPNWFATAALPGRSAVDPRWLAEPATAVRALGRGLRLLHDALPVDGCPFPGRRGSGSRARGPVDDPPPVDRAVVCHGDACAPNTLLADDGAVVGHVDLGALGVADRWADLAVATWSTQRNYGPDWEEPLLDAYGVAPDPERTAYYRRLWDLAD